MKRRDWAAYYKKRKARSVQLGQCIRCKEQAVVWNGKQMSACDRHLNVEKDRIAKRTAIRKQSGLCLSCGKPVEDKKRDEKMYARCRPCRIKQSPCKG